jgi:Family of unknown function (DUF5372)
MTSVPNAECCRRKIRQTTHLQDVPKSVVITRKRHPFEGRSLAVIHSIRRRSVRLVLVILPNGTRSLIPAAWTDWNTESAEPRTPTSHISPDLGRLDDLLRLRALINAFLSRPSESAPHEGSSHAIAPRISRADGSAAEPDNSNKSSVMGANRRDCTNGRTRAPRSTHRPHARHARSRRDAR